MRYLSLVVVLYAGYAQAASYTIDANGINSKTTGLDGSGVRIGQAEPGRPGIAGLDQFNLAAENTFPTQVYRQSPSSGGVDGVNSLNIDDHATGVAGVMIAKAQPSSIWEGVAPAAQLHSVALRSNDDVTLALGLDLIATLNGGPTRAINMSFGHPIEEFVERLDGKSHLTQFVDWSARIEDILYVAAWNNGDDFQSQSPSDNFNGMTIASAEMLTPQTSSVYGKFSSSINAPVNSLHDADGPRTSIDLIAPGDEIRLLETGEQGNQNEVTRAGSSYTVPHVTGAVALLQQYVENEGLGSNAKRHEIMKAVFVKFGR